MSPVIADTVTLAYRVTRDRLAALSAADHRHVLRLLEAMRGADNPRGRALLDQTIQEILSGEPVVATLLPPPAPLSGKRKVWAEVVGREIRRRRDEAGFTQTQLAERTGIPQSHISRLENAEHSANRYTLEKIAAALGITVSELDPTTTG